MRAYFAMAPHNIFNILPMPRHVSVLNVLTHDQISCRFLYAYSYLYAYLAT